LYVDFLFSICLEVGKSEQFLNTPSVKPSNLTILTVFAVLTQIFHGFECLLTGWALEASLIRMGLKVIEKVMFSFTFLPTFVAFEFFDFIVNDLMLLQIFFRCKVFPAVSAGKIQGNLQNEIVLVVVRHSVLFVDFDVSEGQTTNSANQQQKIVMSSYVIRHTLCSKKLDPFFTNETFNSSSHFGWSLMFGEDLKTVT
jgi:hypothetical protein